jgi:hypothetical protein
MPLAFKDGLMPNATRFAEETRAAAPTATAAVLTATSTSTPAVPRTATPTLTAIAVAATATSIPTQPPPPTRPVITPTPTPRPLALLDDFNRPDGVVAGRWLGYPSRFALSGGQLVQAPPTPGADPFNIMYLDQVLGETQTVGIQIMSLGEVEQTSEIGLLLKWQGGPGLASSPRCDFVEVQYEPRDRRASIGYCDDDATSGWETVDDFPLTLNAGDFFSARADAAGEIRVFKNGALVRTAKITDWLFYANPGRPGIWIDDIPGTTLDNFSGE